MSGDEGGGSGGVGAIAGGGGVRDDGVDFDPSGSFPGHFGLSTMRERAEGLGGSLKIESAPGGGTRVRASVPLQGPPKPSTSGDGLAPGGPLPG